jgi:hypothetical protein
MVALSIAGSLGVIVGLASFGAGVSNDQPTAVLAGIGVFVSGVVLTTGWLAVAALSWYDRRR